MAFGGWLGDRIYHDVVSPVVRADSRLVGNVAQVASGLVGGDKNWVGRTFNRIEDEADRNIAQPSRAVLRAAGTAALIYGGAQVAQMYAGTGATAVGAVDAATVPITSAYMGEAAAAGAAAPSLSPIAAGAVAAPGINWASTLTQGVTAVRAIAGMAQQTTQPTGSTTFAPAPALGMQDGVFGMQSGAPARAMAAQGVTGTNPVIYVGAALVVALLLFKKKA